MSKPGQRVLGIAGLGLLRRLSEIKVFRSQLPSTGMPPNHTVQRVRRKRRAAEGGRSA